MKKLFFLTLLCLTFFAATAQKYQVYPQYGGEWNRLLIKYGLGFPNDTVALSNDVKMYPHIAGKGDSLYVWSVPQQKYILFQGAVGSGSGINQLGNTGNLWLTRINDSTYAVDTATANTFYRTLFPQLSGSYANPSWISSLAWSKITGAPTAVSSGSYPTIPAVDTPNRWIVVPDRNNPIFSRENMGQSSPGVWRESSMYAPSPVSINDTLFRVYAKGDATNAIHYWDSRDSMRTWTYMDTAVYPTPSPTWDSVDNAFPFVAYDNTNDTLHLYYTGGQGFNAAYGIGHIAFKSNATYPLTRPSTPMVSNAQLKALSGLDSVSFVNVSSMIKQDGKHYFFGSICKTDTCYLYEARGSDWNNIDSLWIIQRPDAGNGYDGIINPSVYKRGNTWYATFTDSRLDGPRVDTSKSWIASMYSTDNRNWTRLPGYFIKPKGDTSWNGKQVYDLQWLKHNGGNYDSLYTLPKDTLWAGGLKDQTDNYFYGFVSGSYFGCCLDQSGIVYVLPQENNKMNFGITKSNYRNDISFFQRNNTIMLNIPDASTNTRGMLTSTDFRTFKNKADSSGQWSYIHNRTASAQDANFYISGYGRVKKLSAGGNFPDAGAYTIIADGYENSGNVMSLQNSSNFGIKKLTTVSSEITETWTGASEGYLLSFTGSSAHNERFYKKNFSGVFYPFTSFLTLYGKQTDPYVIGMKDNHPVGQGVSRTSSGKVLDINMDGGYNTTSGAITSYGAQIDNTATRESGSNSLTNIGLKVSASGGQLNYGVQIVDGSQGAGKVLTSDANGIATWQTLPGGGSGVYVDTLYNNGSLDSLIYTKNNIRYAIKYPSGGGGSGWALSGNSLTAGVDKLGSTNNTSVRFITNGTQRAILDSLGHLILGSRTNTVYTNAMLNIVAPNSSGSSYSLYVDDAFFSAQHYLANDGKAYHAGNGQFGGTLTTGNPGSGAGAWKFGQFHSASGLILDSAGYIEVNIGGTVYWLALAATPFPKPNPKP